MCMKHVKTGMYLPEYMCNFVQKKKIYKSIRKLYTIYIILCFKRKKRESTHFQKCAIETNHHLTTYKTAKHLHEKKIQERKMTKKKKKLNKKKRHAKTLILCCTIRTVVRKLFAVVEVVSSWGWSPSCRRSCRGCFSNATSIIVSL